MYLDNIKNIETTNLNNPGVIQAVKQVLVGPERGWQGWVMRLFTLEKGGYTPLHTHPWPHINYVTKGEGILLLDGKEYPIESGSVAFVNGDIEHQFFNRGEEDFAFICIVPEEGEKK